MSSSPVPGADYATRTANAAQNAFAATTATNQLPIADSDPPVHSPDTDSDGLTDRFESLVGTDVFLADSDNDGLVDGYEEMVSHTDPMSADTDNDGTADAAEIVGHTDPGRDPASAGLAHGSTGQPGDGVPNGSGNASGVPAEGADADLDGLTDYYETQIGTDPNDPDSDHDGLADNFEAAVGTDPLLIDTDRDGVIDGSEIAFGSDPLAPVGTTGASAPAAVTTVIVVTQSASPAAGTSDHTSPAAGPADETSAVANGTVQHMLDEALAQVGDEYVFGAEVSETDPDPSVWDCAEFTQWSAYQAGAEIPGSSFEQYLDLKAKGLLIPVDQAMNTPGALLFHFSEEPQPGGGRPDEAHVALSLGDGQTVEAQSEEVGVITDDAAGRFEYAALLPGIDYGGATVNTADTSATDAEVGDTTDASGLTLDQVIYGIKMQESHGDYTAENSTSTASGAYQYIDGTWDGYGGYSHASDAPPEVQDAKMRTDTEAAYQKFGDWERVIATHFAGENGQEGPKSEWDKVPGYESNHNPSIRDYVDGVEGYIHDADPSMMQSPPPPATEAPVDALPADEPGTSSTIVSVSSGEPGTNSPLVTVTGAPGASTSITIVQPPQPSLADGIPAGQGGTVDQPSAPPAQPQPDSAVHPDTAPLVAPGFRIDPGVDISDPDADSDADGLSNRFEAQIGSNPTNADTDSDGLNDGMESALKTDPLDVDSDHDGFTDISEIHFGLNPLENTLISPLDVGDSTVSEPPDSGDHSLTFAADPLA